jgi:hypothetical protein
MLEGLKNIFFEYAGLILLIPLFLALKNQKKYLLQFKIVLYYLVLSTATQALSFAFWKVSINNYLIVHIYTILEYLVLLWFYSQILKGFIPKIAFAALFIAFPLFSILDSIFIEDIYTYNTYSRSIEALVFIFLSISWFVKIVAEDEVTREQSTAINYINAGLLIYFAGSITLFAYNSYIEEMKIALRTNVWLIHTVLATQLYILIAIGLWKVKAK